MSPIMKEEVEALIRTKQGELYELNKTLEEFNKLDIRQHAEVARSRFKERADIVVSAFDRNFRLFIYFDCAGDITVLAVITVYPFSKDPSPTIKLSLVDASSRVRAIRQEMRSFRIADESTFTCNSLYEEGVVETLRAAVTHMAYGYDAILTAYEVALGLKVRGRNGD